MLSVLSVVKRVGSIFYHEGQVTLFASFCVFCGDQKSVFQPISTSPFYGAAVWRYDGCMSMKWTRKQLWQRFKKHYTAYPDLGLALDLSRMEFGDDFFDRMEPAMQRAFRAMDVLEGGAIANPDEGRQVGHYWLRNATAVKDETIQKEILEVRQKIDSFADKIAKERLPNGQSKYAYLLLIGIGGSALGPQFVSQALGGTPGDLLKPFFFDNTDPDGFDKVLRSIPDLDRTLCLVISKSGTTPETHNGMIEAKAAFEKAGLRFEEHAVAITMNGSKLGTRATDDKWKEIFPMWEWVGGRTSELSVVGLLPAKLQGINIDKMLEGARLCDEATRKHDVRCNPAARLALMWYYAGNGKGDKDMVILPYKDRLELFSRYLQQLVMESLGKEVYIDGKLQNQGIVVYGNKGSTDQHAYVQQLREGINNFFVTFIEVLKDRNGPSVEIESSTTAGDCLEGLFLGTREALFENGRESITITIDEVSSFHVGVLIALYERAVGYYASLIHINAYHQPGVEAGKKAAKSMLELNQKIIDFLKRNRGQFFSVESIANGIERPDEPESIFKVCEHLAANKDRGINKETNVMPVASRYGFVGKG